MLARLAPDSMPLCVISSRAACHAGHIRTVMDHCGLCGHCEFTTLDNTRCNYRVKRTQLLCCLVTFEEKHGGERRNSASQGHQSGQAPQQTSLASPSYGLS